MELKSWLKLQRGRAKKLARHIDVVPSFVTRIANGEKPVPAEYCRTIVDFTDGAVTVQELLPNDWHKYWPELAVSTVDGAVAAAENVEQGHEMTSARAIKRKTKAHIRGKLLCAIGVDSQEVSLTLFENRRAATLRMSSDMARSLAQNLLEASANCRCTQ